MSTRNPAAVSCRCTLSTSPEFISMSSARLGVAAAVKSVGSAGAWATPLWVMNAKFTYSRPAVSRQAELLFTPAALELKLSMLSAAHHWFAVQLLPAGQDTQPGG